MTANESPLKIDHYIEAMRESSKRLRWVYYVMVVVSVLVFSGYWNEHPDSWIEGRLKGAREARFYVSQLADGGSKTPLTADQQKMFDAGSKFCTRALLKNKDDVELYIKDMQSLYAQRVVMLGVPVFGVSVDVNDLGMIGGFAFWVVLLMLRFNLLRELSNLRIALRAADKLGLKSEVLDILSMGQVVSALHAPETSFGAFWKYLHRSLFLLPAAVHAFGIFTDQLWTQDFADASPRGYFRLLVILEWVFMMAILSLTAECFVTARNCDAVWEGRDTPTAQSLFR